ncbi:MAG TPA: c-type cytochrome [Flavobacterium sp.]|nr:c-type cytochrome [Flavobacterium sp.]
MKKITALLFVALLCINCAKKEEKMPETINYESGAKTPVGLGKELFEGAGNCFACHKPDQKIIGPAIADIAKIYKTQGGDIVSFLKGEGKPLVDPSQYEVMKTNFAITKNMSDEELKALEAYIYSNGK